MLLLLSLARLPQPLSLLLGIIGGLTSVITSTVEGVKTEGGVSGFISGLGKGLVGTVTKPVAGALDFASETAQAVRDTATLSGPRSVVVGGVAFAISIPSLLPLLSHSDMFDHILSALMKWFLKNWIHVTKISDLPNTNTWKWSINIWHNFLYICIYLSIPAYTGCVCVCVIFFLIRLIRNTVASLHTSPVHQTE